MAEKSDLHDKISYFPTLKKNNCLVIKIWAQRATLHNLPKDLKQHRARGRKNLRLVVRLNLPISDQIIIRYCCQGCFTTFKNSRRGSNQVNFITSL